MDHVSFFSTLSPLSHYLAIGLNNNIITILGNCKIFYLFLLYPWPETNILEISENKGFSNNLERAGPVIKISYKLKLRSQVSDWSETAIECLMTKFYNLV
jgi:hypothetical protein